MYWLRSKVLARFGVDDQNNMIWIWYNERCDDEVISDDEGIWESVSSTSNWCCCSVGLFVICLCLSDFIVFIAADFFNLPSDPTRLVRVVQ